jgi:outer membrane protein OmpA-like peptidoglycan-associated protein
MKGFILIICTYLIIVAVPAQADDKDISGSHDHPLVSRYPGSHIITYVAKDFDEYVLPLGPPISNKTPLTFKKSKLLQGKITRIGYAVTTDTSVFKIFKNYENAIKKSGFETLFTCNNDSCGDTLKWQDFFVDKQIFAFRSQRVLSAHKKIQDKDVYLLVYVGDQSRRNVVGLDVIEVKAMESGMVEINADSLFQKLQSEGKVALYGINFEVDKATLLPQSNKTIKAIAEVLRKDKNLRIYVVGHTDDSGSNNHNMQLSKQRAQAVAEELINKFKINSSRILPQGVGPYAPVANNATDKGRALNRRVEIIKRL